MGKGWDISGAVGSVGKHSGGAGGYVGQVNASNQDGGMEGIKNSFDMISKGIESFSANKLAKEKMGLEKEKFVQDMQIQQAKLDMAKEENVLQQAKYASQMKQQEFENELRVKDDQRKQIKSELEMTDWTNKQAVGDIYRNNIGTITEILDKGTYQDLIGNEDYKTMVAGLAAVDPQGAVQLVTDMYTKKAKMDADKKALGTYALTESLYLEEMPKVVADLDAGKSITEAMEPIKQRFADLYKSGNIDHKAVTEQLKSFMSLVHTYSKKSKPGSQVLSFDQEGNQLDPMTNPGNVARQVDVTSGKVTTVGGKSSGNPLKEMMMQKVMESMNKKKGK
jgi:hypothetical protein